MFLYNNNNRVCETKKTSNIVINNYGQKITFINYKKSVPVLIQLWIDLFLIFGINNPINYNNPLKKKKLGILILT